MAARAIAEVLFGRSGPTSKLFKASKPPKTSVQQTATKHTASHAHHAQSITHAAQAPAQAAVTSNAQASRLLDSIVAVAKTLLHPPASGRVALDSAYAHGGAASARQFGGRTAGLHTAARHAASGARPRSGFGTVRPSAIAPRPSSNTMGLGRARNFSSSRPAFENVVQNAPLGLRILGDQDRLDMREFRKEMRRAHLRGQKAKAEVGQSKGKGRMDKMQPFIGSQAAPSSFDTFFPIVAIDASETPSVQLVMPLNPVTESTQFLSTSLNASREDGLAFDDEPRLFSPLLMSDLRMLSDLHAIHQGRIRKLLDRLETAGCFDADPLLGDGRPSVLAHLDDSGARLVVTFLGPERWMMRDVRQVLGLYSEDNGTRPSQSAWYDLVELRASLHTSEMCGGDSYLSASEISLVPSDLDTLTPPSRSPSSTSLMALNHDDFDDMASEQHDIVAASYRFPSPSITADSSGSSYIWGVEDFIQSLHASERPAFVAST